VLISYESMLYLCPLRYFPTHYLTCNEVQGMQTYTIYIRAARHIFVDDLLHSVETATGSISKSHNATK
jgi:hypothetical protein